MKEFSNIKGELLAEQVQEQIHNYIVAKGFAIGKKLPNEFKLGEMFGAGRSTVREAVKILVSRGILEVRRGSGTYVKSLTPHDLDPLGIRDAKDKMAMALDLADVRIMLEPAIAEMAALNRNDEDIAKLMVLAKQIEENIETGVNYIEEDIAFHTCVAECSKNEIVKQLIPIIDTAVLMFVNVTHKKLTKETIMTHRDVVKAISEKDAIGARTAMMMHMTFNRNLIKSIIEEESRR